MQLESTISCAERYQDRAGIPLNLTYLWPWVVKNDGQPHFFHHIGTAWRGDIESPCDIFPRRNHISQVGVVPDSNPTYGPRHVRIQY